jgi:tetratricopeptide (TPR) repeat protein
LDIHGVGDLLRSMGRRDLIISRSRSSGGPREYQFRSRLVAEVAYRMLTDEVRESLHRRVAHLLETGGGTDPEEIASHHERGGEPTRAVRHWVDATLRASARGDGPSVLRCSSRALELGAPPESLFALHVARCDALRFVGPRDTKDVEAALSAASTDAERARAWIEKAGLSSRTGDYVEATRAAGEAIAAARRAADDEVLALALGMSAQALVRTARLSAASEALSEARNRSAGAGPHLRAMVEWWSAELAGAVGDLGARRERFRTAARLFREAGDVRRAASMQANLADVDNRVGAYAEAEAELRSAIEGCRLVGNRVGEGYALVNLGYSLTRLGQSDAALSPILEAQAIARSSGSVHLGVVARLYELRARFKSMPSRDVALAGEELAASAEGRGLTALAVLALALAARARLVAGDHTEADARSGRALELLGDIGGVEEDENEVFLIRAKVLLTLGRKEEAADVLARARRRVEELSAKITDPELRERFRTDVPGHAELWKLVSPGVRG